MTPLVINGLVQYIVSHFLGEGYNEVNPTLETAPD